MSLLTRCPACTTLYKVVPDQLRISQGWVKCGQCGEIFDASQHLLEAVTEADELADPSASDPPPEQPPAAPPEPPAEAAPVSDAAAVAPPDAAAVESSVPEALSPAMPEVSAAEAGASDGSAPPAASEPDPDATPPSAALSPLPDPAGQAPAVDLPSAQTPQESAENADAPAGDGNHAGASMALAGGPDEPIQPGAAEPPADLSAAMATPAIPAAAADAAQEAQEAPALSFMRDARPASRWQGVWGQRLLGVLASLLSLLLLAQWLHQEHDHLAAAQPAWTPALQKICRALRCSVEPLQQIESLAIDAADFSKLGADRYHLSFTLKNSSRLALALPSIELTLTDVQERAVIRRVLSPQDLAALSGELPGNSEWPVNSTLRIASDAGLPAVVGYRLLAFYP